MNPLLCTLCGNTGMVSIYHPKDVRHVIETKTAPLPSGYHRQHFCAVACKCKLGIRYKTWHTKDGVKEMPSFGEAWWHIRPRLRPVEYPKLAYDVVDDVLEFTRDMAENNQFNAALAAEEF